MWPRNIQNDFENFCASLGFEPDTFGIESKRFKDSTTPPLKYEIKISTGHIYNYRLGSVLPKRLNDSRINKNAFQIYYIITNKLKDSAFSTGSDHFSNEN